MPNPLPRLQPLDSALEVGGRLGAGGMGTVYRARELATGRQVALKVLNAGSEAAVLRFVREGEVTAGLSDPRIVKVHGIGTIGGKPCLSYELVEGARTFDEASEADPEAAIPLLIDAAKALGVAHAAGLTHRDVKSENLLVDAAGRVKVTDFGLVTGEELSRLTRSGAWVGTPHTMAPEQFGSRQRVGPPADVWGLGVLLYRVLTGSYPFESADTMLKVASAITRGDFARPSRVASVPPALEAVCLRALELEPGARYPDAASFAAALELAAQDPGRSVGRARPWLAALGLVALVALAASALVVLSRQRAETRERAERELSSLLAPPRPALARFAGLRPNLEPLREAVGSESGDLLFGLGLSAIGEDDEGRARRALARLRAQPGGGPRATVLEACCDARWELSPSDLRAAARRLDAPSVSTSLEGFADYFLLLGRARTLSGDPYQGLEALAVAPAALPDEPWRSLTLRAVAAAGAAGKLRRERVEALGQALPADAPALWALNDWAELTRRPRPPRLAELLERSQVPPEFKATLRDFASRALPVARVPYPSDGASQLAADSNWGKPILGLQIRTDAPVSVEVYRVLADWTVIATAFELERSEELHQVVRSALHGLLTVARRLHLRERQRLFETYLRVAPTPAEIGAYGSAALLLREEDGQRARETLQKLTAGLGGSQRSFWTFWIAHLEVLHRAFGLSSSRAEIQAARAKLLASQAWVQKAVSDPEILTALVEDPAIREVLKGQSDLLGLLWLGLARASVAVGEPQASLAYFERLKSKTLSEAWALEYVAALYATHQSPDTPEATKPKLRVTFARELRAALLAATPAQVHRLLGAAWRGRSLLETDSYLAVEEASLTLEESEPGSARYRVWAAWFALGRGEEEVARAHLQEAAFLHRVPQHGRLIKGVAEGELTQDGIVSLDRALLPEAQPIRRE